MKKKNVVRVVLIIIGLIVLIDITRLIPRHQESTEDCLRGAGIYTPTQADAYENSGSVSYCMSPYR
jgi:hypothetical protein